jgi:hypothetical protein
MSVMAMLRQLPKFDALGVARRIHKKYKVYRIDNLQISVGNCLCTISNNSGLAGDGVARKSPIKATPDRRRNPPPSLGVGVVSAVPDVTHLPYGRRESDAEFERMNKWVATADAVLKKK